jgi:hypothetical protein
MEMHSVPLRGIKVDPLAHELATSEGTRPYLNCVIKTYRNTLLDSKPRSKSYETCRWKSATHGECFPRSSAFADFEDEYVALDLPHIPEPTRSEMTKELELRLQQLWRLLQTFHTE